MHGSTAFSDRRASPAFVFGVIAVTIGVLLHLPKLMIGGGADLNLSGTAIDGKMVAGMALIAFPTVFIVAFVYSRWSTKGFVIGALALTIAGLLGVLRLEFGGGRGPVLRWCRRLRSSR